MNFMGWLFWIFAWGIVITLIIYCYGKILRKDNTSGSKNNFRK